jgi:hypothetical protein
MYLFSIFSLAFVQLTHVKWLIGAHFDLWKWKHHLVQPNTLCKLL